MLQNRKRITTNVLLAITLFTASSLALASTQAEAPKSKSIAAQFVQTAKSATIASIAEAKGEYEITLTNVDPYVSFFSDRPERVTGMLPLAEFINDTNDPVRHLLNKMHELAAKNDFQTTEKLNKQFLELIEIIRNNIGDNDLTEIKEQLEDLKEQIDTKNKNLVQFF